MIIRPGPDGTVHLITQPDHARLASTLISAWDAPCLRSPASRAAVLFAIAEHDNGWREIDAGPLFSAETGRPHDFMDLPAALKRDIWPRGVRRLAGDSPLAAALVAQHALALHGHRRGDPDWDAFLSEIERLQATLTQQAAAEGGLDREAFERAYDLLYVGDVVSLVFCNRWRDPMDARSYRVRLAGEDDEVIVAPDPFRGTHVHFEVAARALPDRPYPSQRDLLAAFADAPVVRLSGTASGPPASEDWTGYISR